MVSKTDIGNMALSALGISQRIANIDTERSNEALTLKVWYDISLLFMLEDFDWNAARRRVALAELADVEPPSTWTRVYTYPTDCAKARRIEVPGTRTPYSEQRIGFEVAGVTLTAGDTKVIYCDQAKPVLVFTKLLTDTALFDANFALTLAYLLASNAGMPLQANAKMIERAWNSYGNMKMTAIASHLNESQDDPEPMGETERARNG